MEQKAIKTYIETGGNQCLTYKATHPNASLATVRAGAHPFVETHRIAEKALAVLNKDKILNAEDLTKSLKEEVQATKTTLYKGKKYEFPDYPTRLQAKRTVLLDIYGLGRKSDGDTNYNDNRQITINAQPDKLAEIAASLKQIQSTLEADRKRREKAGRG